MMMQTQQPAAKKQRTDDKINVKFGPTFLTEQGECFFRDESGANPHLWQLVQIALPDKSRNGLWNEVGFRIRQTHSYRLSDRRHDRHRILFVHLDPTKSQ